MPKFHHHYAIDSKFFRHGPTERCLVRDSYYKRRHRGREYDTRILCLTQKCINKRHKGLSAPLLEQDASNENLPLFLGRRPLVLRLGLLPLSFLEGAA